MNTESYDIKIMGKFKKTKEERCEKIMQETTQRTGGRFETGSLWRKLDIKCPDNKQNALI